MTYFWWIETTIRLHWKIHWPMSIQSYGSIVSNEGAMEACLTASWDWYLFKRGSGTMLGLLRWSLACPFVRHKDYGGCHCMYVSLLTATHLWHIVWDTIRYIAADSVLQNRNERCRPLFAYLCVCASNGAYWGDKYSEYRTFSGGLSLHTNPRSEQGVQCRK